MDDLLPGFEDEVKMRKRRSVSSLQPRVCVRARDAQYVYGCVEPRRTCVQCTDLQCDTVCEKRRSMRGPLEPWAPLRQAVRVWRPGPLGQWPYRPGGGLQPCVKQLGTRGGSALPHRRMCGSCALKVCTYRTVQQKGYPRRVLGC